jgi:hypothetical protein
VERRAGEALDAVRERVRAGRGGELRRQADGEFGVEDDELGEQFGMEEHSFSLRGIKRDDRAATHFAAGAGGRRDRDERR